MYLVQYIIYIAELGNTPGRRRLWGYEMFGLGHPPHQPQHTHHAMWLTSAPRLLYSPSQ